MVVGIDGVASLKEDAGVSHDLADFWATSPDERVAILIQAINESHAWHFERNRAYRYVVSARGVGPTIEKQDL